MVPVECYFVLSALLFFIGVYGFVTRRNLIAMLISIELVLNAVDINFAAFNRLLFLLFTQPEFVNAFQEQFFAIHNKHQRNSTTVYNKSPHGNPYGPF